MLEPSAPGDHVHALVTGASGFLGGRLVELLVGRGIEVSILARPSSVVAERPGVHVVRAELAPSPASNTPEHPQLAAALAPVLAHITHVFHCAGCSTDWAPLAQYRDANITAVATLLALLEQHAPRLQRLLHVSTTDVYGYPVSAAGDETMPTRATGLPYNETKRSGEALVWQAAARGLPVTVVRPASIYGPHGKAFVTDVVTLLKQRLMLLVDSGRAPGGFVYVDDVCHAMWLAAMAPGACNEAYNLSSVDGATWHTYTTALARALALPAPWLHLPFVAAMALATVSELPHKAGLPGRPLLTRHAVYLLARDQQYNTRKAQQQLGWQPSTPLEQGIQASVAPLLSQR
ncbi:NAD(P)-dependent oxidoreductase [Acidipila sp. EB88]|uniref:NAD-dependent epimerase/dehydratase family protein n=1 Tax=Acidipila sp. EB88 TaxID=2305226 RepID=UPI0013154ABE|nr:NAD-dependent epimerase/dehydratase family protein [Acidipila sp. EB88]